MKGLIDRLLSRYDDREYTLKLKARFLLYASLVSLLVIPVAMGYSIFLQLHDPMYNYTIDLLPILPIFAALLIVSVYTVLLVKGYFGIVANGILIMLTALAWTIMFMDRSDAISRLDTVAIIFAIITVTPLAVTKHPRSIFLYAAVNSVILFIFVEYQDSQFNFLPVTYFDYLLDNLIVLFFITIFTYNIYMISRRALDRTDEQKRKLADVNEDLHLMNEMLKTAHERSIAEIELAGAMQETIFPKKPPLAVGWDIAFTFRPASSVSGDFYDFYYDERGLQGIALFDVSGHGVASGLITMIAKPILYRTFTESRDKRLDRLMDGVGETILKEIRNVDSFITGIVLRFMEGRGEYVNVGHHDLLMREAGTDRVRTVAPASGDFRSSPIGRAFGKPEFSAVSFGIGGGDTLCLMTDGILEGRDGGREKFGKERMMNAFRLAPDGTAQEILDYIEARFDEFMGEKRPHDDYVVIIAKKNR